MNVLLVEDEYLIAMITKDALEDEGHHVLGPVASVEQGIDLAERHALDLALIDINLQEGGNGVDLARELLDRWQVPSLFVSGQALEARRAKDAALGLVAKPYSPDLLLKSVAVAEKLMTGQRPGRVPPGLELFDGPESG